MDTILYQTLIVRYKIVSILFLIGLTTAFSSQAAPAGPDLAKPVPKIEEEDFSQSPFTEYGEFNQSDEEEEDANFFQFGRFFGASLGMGFQFIDGNRGALWQGGFPVVEFKLHYWFDFNLALDLGFTTATHFYDDTSSLNNGLVIANIFKVGVNVKYYFPTKNLAAAISFANPYILAGAGLFSKTENSITNTVQDQDNSLGVVGGLGLEFVVRNRKIYFAIEYKISIVTFLDTFTTRFQPGLDSLTGNFHSVTGGLLFTW